MFRFVSCPNYTYEVSLTENIFLPGWFYLKTQWWILGKGPGGPPPLFLDQTEDQRVEKKFFETAPPPPYLKVRAPFVQKVYNTIHRINLYPVDSAIGSTNTYPLDSDLFGG